MHMNKINKKIYLWMYVGGKMYENRIRTGRFFFFLKSSLFLSCERVNLEQENSTYLFWIFQFRFMLNFLICTINRLIDFFPYHSFRAFGSKICRCIKNVKYIIFFIKFCFFKKKPVSSLWKKNNNHQSQRRWEFQIRLNWSSKT